ncbi:CDP-diacylglycerol--serine O-phosphatidyltransferase [Terribacillus sp. 179-K 1B1 HS]|uniref:CDP-diacylglycerol--serine O-phosphatidyltransferase n=1 Tax=Terribacillus sp. 179-K 1B1 HS TaxID=3142388 RepID=UPI0039A07A50
MNILKHIPNSITLANMYCGFLSIGFTVANHFDIAVLLILLGMMLDGIDGRLARRFNANSKVGKELDSLADIITFGIAPCILFSYTNTIEGSVFDYSLAGLFLLSGGFRLARFNSETTKDISYFTGVPITAAGGILALSTLFHSHIPPIGNFLIIAVLSYLMVSKLQIPSFKNISLPNTKTTILILIGVLLLVFDTISITALILTLFYIIYIVYRIRLLRTRKHG